MTLDTLLTRLIWIRRAWLGAALFCGLLHVMAVLIYLYGAWAQFMLLRNGLAAFSQLNMPMVRLVQFWGSQLDGILQIARILCLAVAIVWFWFSGRFAMQACPQRKPRFGPWIVAGSWFVPLVNVIVPPMAMMQMARATRLDPLMEEPSPERHGRTMTALVFLAHGLYIATILLYQFATMQAMRAAGQPDALLGLLHLAAAGGVVTLLWLLALDAFMRALMAAQETRLARHPLPERPDLTPPAI
ncbi:DUF4328 domain-containing protein [Allorhizobium undicola]|uniref:DUF4328 domain-containing protein n=1 Tax=Allorhizobium undicola TaxID=78527 RepID=UPI003D334ECD